MHTTCAIEDSSLELALVLLTILARVWTVLVAVVTSPGYNSFVLDFEVAAVNLDVKLLIIVESILSRPSRVFVFKKQYYLITTNTNVCLFNILMNLITSAIHLRSTIYSTTAIWATILPSMYWTVLFCFFIFQNLLK